MSSHYKVIQMCLHLAQGVLCRDMVIDSIAAEHTMFYYIYYNINFDTDLVDLKVTISAFINVYTRLLKARSLISSENESLGTPDAQMGSCAT